MTKGLQVMIFYIRFPRGWPFQRAPGFLVNIIPVRWPQSRLKLISFEFPEGKPASDCWKSFFWWEKREKGCKQTLIENKLGAVPERGKNSICHRQMVVSWHWAFGEQLPVFGDVMGHMDSVCLGPFWLNRKGTNLSGNFSVWRDSAAFPAPLCRTWAFKDKPVLLLGI